MLHQRLSAGCYVNSAPLVALDCNSSPVHVVVLVVCLSPVALDSVSLVGPVSVKINAQNTKVSEQFSWGTSSSVI